MRTALAPIITLAGCVAIGAALIAFGDRLPTWAFAVLCIALAMTIGLLGSIDRKDH